MRIVYAVDEDGNIVFDFQGFKGKTCVRELSKILESLKELGVSVDIERQDLKSEYYEQEEVIEQ